MNHSSTLFAYLLLTTSALLLAGCNAPHDHYPVSPSDHYYEASSESTEEYVMSSALAVKVKTALLADSEINSLHISVKALRDKILLSGYVYSDYQRKKAVIDAKNVRGVSKVIDRLQVVHER